MRPIADAAAADLAAVEFVLTDMDDTLTFRGRLAARTYSALEELQDAGVKVIPVTAAPAGWCDQMARMWPVDAVIGENGALYLRHRNGAIEHNFWSGAAVDEDMARLRRLGDLVLSQMPDARIATDQPFRLASLAFDRLPAPDACNGLVKILRANGAGATVNSLWVLASFGGFDKLAMSRRLMQDLYGIDIEQSRQAVFYVGDSANDAPMFRHFPKSAGVSTVVEHLADIDHPPAWITRGPGGAGFVEVAEAIIAAKQTADARAHKQS